MAAGRRIDEEHASSEAHDIQPERYRDDPDDEGQTSETASPVRPAEEFDVHRRNSRPGWRSKLSDSIPSEWKTAWTAVVDWVKGPQPPRVYRITPFFPKAQHVPIALLDRYAPKRIHRFGLLMALYACWLLSFSLILWKSSVATEIPGHGSPIRLSCGARYWSDGNGCGLNGDECRPFANATLAFRCPADCHKTQILNPHAVGDQEVVYRPLVVGGPTDQQTGYNGVIVNDAVYRGDSFICASAVHSGFISDIEGGCGVLTLTGEQSSFPASKRNGIESVGFDSYFPHSFGFLSGSRAQCKDLRWPALVPSVILTALLSLFTTDPAVHFWSIFVALFFHVGLVSDPPSLTTYYDLLSVAFGRFLPACFCSWITYRYTVKRSLTGLTAQIEKTVLWLGPAWVGALNNYTFDKIPIQRLTPHDLKAQPGAIPALIIVILVIFCIALGQAWAFRVEGRMPRYLAIYGLMVATLLVLLAVPGLDLRIHHYILALLFLPGTSFQNRPSLIYQGLLVGLFINGTARWGFASILETPASLLRGAPQDSLLPILSAIILGANSTVTFDFGTLPRYDDRTKATYDGVSVLVNDVEHFRGYVDDHSAWGPNDPARQHFTWTWRRNSPVRDNAAAVLPEAVPSHAWGVVPAERDLLPEYFRFAYMSGSSVADYSKAGKLTSDDGWVSGGDGPSL